MRVLVITPTPTHPTNQGNRARVLQISNALKRTGAIVEVLCYAMDAMEPDTVSAMRAAWDAVHIVPVGDFVPRRRHPAYWGIDDWVSPQLIETVRYLNDIVRYDAVIINYVWLSLLATIFDRATTVRILDTHDAFGDRHVLARSAGMQPSWFYTTKAQESLGLNRADLVLAIQPDEALYFRRLTTTAVEVIEYAVAPQFLPARPHKKINVGYIGSGNPWNVESVRQFDRLLAAREGAASLRGRANFLLFGGVTKMVEEPAMFQSMGVVDEVQDAYAMMNLVVNPMVGGTGLKIKTVEALAFGKPVLSTKEGGAGLETIHEDLLHANLSEMADRMAELVMNADQLLALGHRMQTAYARFYDHLDARLTNLLMANISLPRQAEDRAVTA